MLVYQGALDDCQRKLTDSEKTAAVQQERLSNAQSSLANAQHELSEQVSENKKLQESADGARVRLEGMAAEILTTRQMQADTRRQLDELLSAKDGDTSAQLTGVAKTLSELVTRSQAMDDKLAGYSQTTQQALNNQTSTLINMLVSSAVDIIVQNRLILMRRNI